MSVHFEKAKNRWVVMYRISGVQKKRTFGKDEQAARDFDKNLKPQLGGIVAAYIDYLEAKGCSKRYVNEMSRVLNAYVVMDSLFPDHYGPTTVNRYTSYKKLFFSWASLAGHLKENPLKAWKKKPEAKRQLLLTVEDLRTILANSAPHLVDALKLRFYIGCRPDEVLNIKWTDVDTQRGLVHIRPYKLSTKTKERSVPCDPVFLKELYDKRDKSCDYVICYKGHKVTRLQTAWEGAIRRAGIEYKPCLHDLRHLFITELLRRGSDPGAVSKMAGHSTVKMTTDVYHEVYDREKRRAISLLPKL